MCVHQTEKTVQDLDIINQLILGDTSNEKSGIYILPVFTRKVEIAAALFGLKYTLIAIQKLKIGLNLKLMPNRQPHQYAIDTGS